MDTLHDADFSRLAFNVWSSSNIFKSNAIHSCTVILFLRFSSSRHCVKRTSRYGCSKTPGHQVLWCSTEVVEPIRQSLKGGKGNHEGLTPSGPRTAMTAAAIANPMQEITRCCGRLLYTVGLPTIHAPSSTFSISVRMRFPPYPE